MTVRERIAAATGEELNKMIEELSLHGNSRTDQRKLELAVAERRRRAIERARAL